MSRKEGGKGRGIMGREKGKLVGRGGKGSGERRGKWEEWEKGVEGKGDERRRKIAKEMKGEGKKGERH